MAQDNHVTLTGNATKDPELRFTTGGRGVASFGLAVNRRWQQNREWKEAVSFFPITAWGDLAENTAASIAKGNRVTVTGRLEQRTYDDRDGNNRSVVEVIADDVAVSLRWAQAQIERITRDAATGTPNPPPPDPIYGDDEPF